MIKNIFRYPAAKIAPGIIAGILLGILLVLVWDKLGAKYALLYFGGLAIIGLLLCIVILLWRNIQHHNANKMEGALAKSIKTKSERQAQVKAALASLKDKWDQAIITLKSTRTNIYDLPWVLLIGEPQSGKTTTLRQSGLDFPLGKEALSGTGGTVNCDWWFSNDAIIIDTAGRFTMPVDAAPDKEEWRAFLNLLRKHRPRCPISSVVVTIPATSLLSDDPTAIQEKAGKIREKLLELVRLLGVDFPTYIMISKSDLIYGFAEFCDSLSSVENTQILGWNNNELERGPFRQSEFDFNFDKLAGQFKKWGLRRLREMPVGREADKIYAFPSEFNNIRENLEAYLKRVFRQDRFNTPLFFRGCFFSSGLQQGTAIASALQQQSHENLLNTYKDAFVQSRPYFIYHFYKKVFLENGLVKRIHQSTRRELGLRAAAGAFAAVFSAFAIWFLITGYTSLNRLLNPIKKNVTVAEQLFLARKNVPDIPAGEILSLVDALETSRLSLQSSKVPYRFLKGRKNAIVRDISRIEDKLAEQCLFSPLMTLADEALDSRPSLSIPEKDLLVLLLKIKISMLNGQPPTEVSFDPVVDFLKQSDHAWVDIQKFHVEEVRHSLPRSRDADTDDRYPLRTTGDTRRSLESLNRFWRTYHDQQWVKLRQTLEKIAYHYNDILACRSGRPNGGTLQEFADNVDALKDYYDELSSLQKNNALISPDALSEACVEDYNKLLGYLAENDNFSEASRLKHTLERHMHVCSENKSDTMDEADTETFGFLLDENGHINTEFTRIMDILSKTVSFGPLFTEIHGRLISQNVDGASDLIKSWHTEWITSKDDTAKKINALLDKIESGSLKKETLRTCTAQYLDNRLWEADRAAVLTAARKASGKHLFSASFLEKGMEPPLPVQAKWLAERFQMLNGLKTWLGQVYPMHPGRRDVSLQLNSGMVQSYASCLYFWKHTLRNYTPTAAIMQTTNWRSFRNHVIAHRGILIDTISFPMNMFLEYMSFNDFQMIRKSVAVENKPKLKRLEKELANITYIYGGSGYAASLADTQKQFLSIVAQLPDNPTAAWQTIKGNGKDQTMDGGLGAYKVFSRFKHTINRDGKIQGDRFSNELVNVERHGIRLMNNAFKRSIHLDWQQLVSEWQDLRHTYPFGTRCPAGDVSFQKNTWKTAFSTVDATRLHDFFFSVNKGFENFVKRYDLEEKIQSNAPSPLDAFLNQERFRFITECWAWRCFLYDKDGNPKIHKIKLTLKPQDGSSARQFTVLRIKGLIPADKNHMIRLRFSGRSYKESYGRWHIDLNDVISFTAVNEETHHMSQFVLNSSDLSLPAFLTDANRRAAGPSDKAWTAELKLPDISVQKEQGVVDYKKYHIPVNVQFEWDEKIPQLIRWPEWKNEVVHQ